VNFRPNPFTRSGGRGLPFVQNGELLRGQVYSKDGAMYLKVSEIKRKGAAEFTPVSGDQWMPFDGGAYNGGKWLHDVCQPCGR